jgi:hypothetical protein
VRGRERVAADGSRECRASVARSEGVAASGEVGDPIDPLAGVADELQRHRTDQLIVTSRGEHHSNWVESELVAKPNASKRPTTLRGEFGNYAASAPPIHDDEQERGSVRGFPPSRETSIPLEDFPLCLAPVCLAQPADEILDMEEILGRYTS